MPEILHKMEQAETLIKEAQRLSNDLRQEHVQANTDGFFEANNLKRSLVAASRALLQAQGHTRRYAQRAVSRGGR